MLLFLAVKKSHDVNKGAKIHLLEFISFCRYNLLTNGIKSLLFITYNLEMDPNSQQQVIKVVFCSLIVENTKCTLN